jgi:hypothetical protein
MSRGERPLFLRDFEGYERKGMYIEVLQKLLHVFSLHFIDERSAYCRLDNAEISWDSATDSATNWRVFAKLRGI